ncbi:uncharacterized protein LOC135157537 [Lytechinus pictus]|uniref:uncharacterized protein LOC135157537 n=1 Tax=Lytechinus pictus TaxID=7653 RepID=UPI0030B9D398
MFPPPLIKVHEVYARLNRLNVSKATHPNDIPIRLIKEFELSSPLTKIYNDCLRSGYFPLIWKNASVCPVPKVPNVIDFSQLRPISVTTAFARIFESFLAEWLTSDLGHRMDCSQFGNLKGSSINHYLVSLLDVIQRNLDKQGHYANLCAVDFMKAFGLINHTLAIQKLIGSDVDTSVLPTVCSFLTHRSQAVRYQGKTSSALDLTSLKGQSWVLSFFLP